MKRFSEIGRVLARIDRMHILLTLTLLIALALRLYGIRWGLPDASHPTYSYHPDEALHLMAARWLQEGKIVDKHFMYGGTLHFTILSAFNYFGAFFGNIVGGFNQLASSILIGRYFLIGVALMTIALVYGIGRQLFDSRIGVLAAFFLALAPAHVVMAQSVRPDEIAALFVALVLFLGAKIFQCGPEKIRGYLLLSGFIVGVATSLRAPLAALIIVPATAYLFASGSRSSIRALLNVKLLGLLLVAVIGFVVTSPHVFLYPEIFIRGLAIQWRYQTEPFLDAVEMGPGIYQYGWGMLHQALGYPLYFMAAAGIGLAAIKRSREDLLLAAAGLPYFVAVVLTSWVVVRYTVPLLPVLVILAARFTFLARNKFHRRRVALDAVVLAAAIWTLAADIAYLRIAAGPDIRDVTSEWIKENISRSAGVLTVKTYVEDDFFNPIIPVEHTKGIFFLYSRNDSAGLDQENVNSILNDSRIGYVVLNEYLYKSMERLGGRHPLLQHRVFYRALMAGRYRLIKEFKHPVTLAGLNFSDFFSSHDYTMVNPGIRIYSKK